MSTPVKYFHSAQNGAPVLNGTAGSLLGVLDACLVTGFGLQAASSVTVASGIATINFAGGHSFEPDTIALIAGASPAGLNGEARILSTSTNAITYAAPGVADGTATGTITAQVASAGWVKAYNGTNVAAYVSADPTSTKMYLRVDDAGNTNARVVGYESMTDVNTGTGPFPTGTQINGGGWWPKANNTTTTARAWTLVADSLGFYLHMHTATTSSGVSGCVWEFGDFTPAKSSDPYACNLQANSIDIATSVSAPQSSIEQADNVNARVGAYLPRSFTALGGAVAAVHMPAEFINSAISGSAGANTAPVYPNGPDNGLLLSKKLIVETGVCRRGVYRGVYLTPQNCHASFNWRDKIDGQGALAGRKLLAIKCGSPAGTSSQGVIFIDITGPWGS